MATSLRPGQTTADLLRGAAAAHPDREAYVHGEKRVSYAWLDRAADGFAATLIDLGVAPGDVVGLLLPSSIKFAACYLGALRAGAVTSAINLRLGPAEQASIISRTEPRVTVVGDGASVPDGVDAGHELPVTELGHALGADPPARLPEISPTDPACIVWTSGTTGAPKGAVYDHATMAVISRNIGELTRRGDRRLLALPFPHVGYMTRMWDELANGTTLVLVGEPWSAEETLRLVRDEGITMATGVPTQWSLVLAHPDVDRTDFSNLRVAAIGGAAIAPELVRQMRKVLGCPVITRYTSTEAGVTTSTLASDDDDTIANTVGRPAPEVELRITGENGAAVTDGEVGEVCCRSDAMFKGYWRDPDTTAATVDGDGWLHTGDLGFVGGDGNLRIVGRLKEMYIRGGYNVYPAEVEGVLAEHPSVARAAVVGVPDPVLGEIGAAFVVPAAGGSPPALDTLRAWCRDRLADYKAPDRLTVVDELPLTSMLKVDKRALAAAGNACAELSGEGGTMTIQEVGTGDSTERPIKLGGALFTMVEPHRGHEVAYNRWYERDHFYAGCMIGSWTVAGARFVATRACKDKRYPGESPVTPDPMVGSYLAIYWILAGKFDEWTQWGVNQVNWLHANDRMFAERDHIHTLMYRFLEERTADSDGVPAELALDHRFRGLAAVIGEPAEGASIDDVTKWFGSRPLPADLLIAFTPVPLFGDAPSDVPRETADNRLLHLYFTDDDVLGTWDDRFGSLGKELEASGTGRILFASPFLPTVPGTDTYSDQLW